MENFIKLLEGAHEMDKHFKETPLHKNVSCYVINFFINAALNCYSSE